MSWASGPGLPKIVDPWGWVIANGVPGKSVRMSATFQRRTDGSIDGST
jgi:hypothetical protein